MRPLPIAARPVCRSDTVARAPGRRHSDEPTDGRDPTQAYAHG